MMSAVSRALALVLTPLVALAIALPLASVPATSADGAGGAGRGRDFSVTAHRGGPTRTLGENTMAAFRHSLRAGATAIETDVRRTQDDELVVLHDSGLGRTTTCTGPIGAWTRRQLDRQCLERTGRKPIPHVEELLTVASSRAELIIGATYEPALGHFLIVGLGGIHAEMLDSVALIPAFVSDERLAEMVEGSIVGELVERLDPDGEAELFDQIVEAVLALRDLLRLRGDDIASVDVNPLLLTREGCVAVDALIVRR